MSKIEEAKKLLIDAGNLCAEEIGTDERIKIHALIKVVLALLESEPEPTKLQTDFIFEMMLNEIDRLTAENAKQKQLIELIEYAVSRRGHYE